MQSGWGEHMYLDLYRKLSRPEQHVTVREVLRTTDSFDAIALQSIVHLADSAWDF